MIRPCLMLLQQGVQDSWQCDTKIQHAQIDAGELHCSVVGEEVCICCCSVVGVAVSSLRSRSRTVWDQHASLPDLAPCDEHEIQKNEENVYKSCECSMCAWLQEQHLKPWWETTCSSIASIAILQSLWASEEETRETQSGRGIVELVVFSTKHCPKLRHCTQPKKKIQEPNISSSSSSSSSSTSSSSRTAAAVDNNSIDNKTLTKNFALCNPGTARNSVQKTLQLHVSDWNENNNNKEGKNVLQEDHRSEWDIMIVVLKSRAPPPASSAALLLLQSCFCEALGSCSLPWVLYESVLIPERVQESSHEFEKLTSRSLTSSQAWSLNLHWWNCKRPKSPKISTNPRIETRDIHTERHTERIQTSQQKASDRPDPQMVCRFISEEGEEILELLRYLRKMDVALNFGDRRREEIRRAWIDRKQERTHERQNK